MLNLNTIHRLDCIEAMKTIDAGSVDLVHLPIRRSISVTSTMSMTTKGTRTRIWTGHANGFPAFIAVLKPTGTFWLAIWR